MEIIIKESDLLWAKVGLEDDTEAGRYEGDVIYEYFWDGDLEGSCTQSVAFTVVDIEVEVDGYIGIDMTGDYLNKTNSKTATATVVPEDFEFSWDSDFDAAQFDPPPPDSCTNARIIEVDAPSGSYSNEAVIVEAGPCTATSRFTVVKMDVEMQGLDEQGLDEDEEEGPGGLVHLNADDDDNNGVLDKDQDGPITNEDDLVQFTVEILPDDLPTNDRVKVTGGTDIYHDDEKKFPMTSNVFTLAELAATNFYVEGTAVSGSPTNYIVQADHEQSDADAVDRALYTVIRADIDIDSDNTSDFRGPDRTDLEEAIEVGSTNPVYEALKYVVVDDYYDDDTNGIPGYADGYDNDGTDGKADDAISVAGPVDNEVFVPIEVRVDHPFPKDGTTIEFAYDGASTTEISPTIVDGVKTWETSGNLRIWTEGQGGRTSGNAVNNSADQGDFVPPNTEISLNNPDLDIGIGTPKTLYVEGLDYSGSLGSESIEIIVRNTNLVEDLELVAEDEIKFTTIKTDVDVDTDNDGGYTTIERNLAEDHYEDIKDCADYPGKLMAVNDNDDDGDGIPDFADGYDLGLHTNDNANLDERFVPIVFHIPKPVDLSKAKVKLTYDASDPLGVTTNSAGEYVLRSGGGHLRIWTKDGDKERDGQSVKDGGDFLPSQMSAGEEYSAEAFGFTNGMRTLTYYLEGVDASQAIADQRILFEVDPDGDVSGKPCPGYIAADAVRVTILSVEFKTYAKTVPGPGKPHDLNLDTRQNEDAHYDPYSKCVSHIWSSDALDMAQYLDGYDDHDMRAIFRDVLKWQVNGSWQDSYELNLGSEPDSDEITRFNIGVACESGGDIQDYLIITVVPPSTQTDFNQWHTAEAADMGWLAELPALYSSLTYDAGGDPEDPEPGPCDFWNGPGESDTFYHPDGHFKMRSKKTAGDHGHQAIFQAQADGGGIIKTGVSAGSADREAPYPEQLRWWLHVNADVKPFVWAAQLDGNPVEESGETMTEPMLHEGGYLGRYFQVRPVVANALPDLAPGTCP